MNIDDLISQYIDGDLSEREDERLRSALSEDSDKKKEFDFAVNLHYAMKEDAKNIQIPSALVSDTQDRILMRIMNEKPLIQKQIDRKKFAYRAISAAAAVILFGFSMIKDLPEVRDTYTANKLAKTELTANDKSSSSRSNDRINTQNGSEIKHSKAQRSVQYKSDLVAVVKNTGISSLVDKDAMKALAPENGGKSADVSEPVLSINSDLPKSKSMNEAENRDETNFASSQSRNYFASKNQFALTAGDDNKVSPVFTNQNYRFNSELLESLGESVNTKIETNTYISSNIYNNVSSKGATTLASLTQSIGVRLNENSAIGFEFGYMNFQRFNTKDILVRDENGNLYSDNLNTRNPGVPVPTIRVPFTFKQDFRIFLGAMFYEFNALDAGFLKINTRLGIGGTKAGLINFGRLTAAFNIYNGITANIGVDAKLFQSELGLDNPRKDWRHSFSIVYGLKFDL
jgi:hypothetical protein